MKISLLFTASFLSFAHVLGEPSPCPHVISTDYLPQDNVTHTLTSRQNGPWGRPLPPPPLPQGSFPQGGRTSQNGLLPFVKSGSCQRGWSYTILDVDDLMAYGPSLECIFSVGVSPSKVPVGPLTGTVLSLLNMDQFDPMINLIWKGKVVRLVECPSSPPTSFYIGWNNLLGHLIVPFLSYAGSLQVPLSTGEYNDGRSNWIIDYTQDFSTVCEDFTAFQESAGMDLPQRNIFPLNQVVDALRLVGRRPDGGNIFLGKSFMRDHSPAHVYSTVVYFAFVNYDAQVNPEFRIGQSLPPLSNSFTYTIPGI